MSLSYHQVRTQEEFDKVKAFAEEFNHDISQAMPVVVAEHDGKMIGYYQILQEPIVIMAYHPEIGARDFKRFSEDVKAYRTLSSFSAATPEGRTYMLMSKDSPIPESVAEKMGFHDTGLKLFST